ncbi:MAG: hypothetical protein ACRDYU_07160 [Actinomycetes bacterium]
MFIQVIRGHVIDSDEVKAALDRWVTERGSRTPGWLGTTAGITDSGTLVAAVRFDSEESARRNSESPEQHQWWMETSKLFSGDVTFRDSTECDLILRGGSDEAGFVQVMTGRITDKERLREMGRRMEDALSSFRPDVLGGTVAFHADGTATQTMYFTSETAAREGERKAPPPEVQAMLDEDAELFQDVTFDDLREPWLYSRA